MQKVFFAILLAMLMTLALVGVKRVFVNTSATSPTTVAIGGAPTPPIPW
jgi:hypothetical protein